MKMHQGIKLQENQRSEMMAWISFKKKTKKTFIQMTGQRDLPVHQSKAGREANRINIDKQHYDNNSDLW